MRIHELVLAQTAAGPDETARAEVLECNKQIVLAQIVDQALDAIDLVRSVHGLAEPVSPFEPSTEGAVLQRDKAGRPLLVGRTVVHYYSIDRDVGTPDLDDPTVYADVAVVVDAYPHPDKPGEWVKFPKQRRALLDGSEVIVDRIDGELGYNTEEGTLMKLRRSESLALPGAPDAALLFSYYSAMEATIKAITDAAINPDLNPLVR